MNSAQLTTYFCWLFLNSVEVEEVWVVLGIYHSVDGLFQLVL